MKDEVCVELTELLAEEFNWTPRQAIDALYTSKTLERLQDDATGLYYQSPGYIFTYIRDELKSAETNR